MALQAPTRGATTGATDGLYDQDEWLEIDNNIYEYFYNMFKQDEVPVNAYGFYSQRLGRAFVCITKIDDDEMLTAISCVNMVVDEFHKLDQPKQIDEVIVALGYVPTPL